MGIMDDRTGALRGTHAAGDAALLHDLGVAVNHMDCISRTYPLAHAAGDAARAAGLAGGRALVRTRAERLDRIVCRHDLDQVLRARLRAEAAADTELAVDVRDALV